MEGLVEMADTDSGEEEMINSLFYRCDTQDEGAVYVCAVIQYLKNCLGNGNNEPDLIELSHILESGSIDGKVTFQAYRAAVKNWISDIRQRCESTAFLEQDGPLQSLHGNNVSNNAADFSLNIETSVDGSSFRVENDISELLNKVEDLKYMNHKLTEDNLQLNSQLEAQDEQITNLTTELQNQNKEEEQLKKKFKSLQDLANLTQNVMEENEELKTKLVITDESKKEVEGKVVNLDREKLDLENQVREIENKWQVSCSDLELALRETQQLKTVCNELKEQLVQTQESQTTNEHVLTQRNDELESLKEKLNALMSQNEKLQEEKEDVQVQLAQMNGKLLSYQSKAEQQGMNDSSVEDVINPTTKKSPKLWFSTPLHRNSICMELKDRLNEDKSLPSPFCEKLELSHNIISNKKSALLPPYMSAWDLEMSGGSNDFSVELLSENKDLSPLMYDKLDSMKDPSSAEKLALLPVYMSNWEMSSYTCGDKSTDLMKSRKSLSQDYLCTEAVKRQQQLKDLGDSALQKEYLRLYRTNLELAEKCHRAELKEVELQEALKEANHRSDFERQKFLHLEESLETSSIARKLDLKDLWRLVHNPDEDDSLETEESISASTELLKKQIQAEIQVLRNKLAKKKKVSKFEKTRILWYSCRKRRAISPLVEALDIDIVNNTRNQKFFKDEVYSKDKTVDNHSISSKDNVQKCNRSVPLIRRSSKQDRSNIQPVDTDDDISDKEIDIDACENFESVFDETAEIDKMHGRKDIPARFHSESTADSELWTLGRLKSAELNSVDNSIIWTERSQRGRTTGSTNELSVEHSRKSRAFEHCDETRDLKGRFEDDMRSSVYDKPVSEGDKNDKENIGFRRRSYRKAIANQTCSEEEMHILRSRSHSFQKAIEQGQVSPSGSCVSNGNPPVTDITPEYEGSSSMSLTSAPRYSSTPFLTSSAKSVHFEFEPHSSEYNSDSQYEDEKLKSEVDNHGAGMKDVQDEVSMSCHKELLKAENQETDGICQCKDDQVSTETEINTEGDSDNASLSSLFKKVASSPVSGSSQPDMAPGLTPEMSPPLEYNCSAEFWSLSPSSGSPEDSEISRDSGHSSSIASLEKTGYPLTSDTDQSNSPDSSDEKYGADSVEKQVVSISSGINSPSRKGLTLLLKDGNERNGATQPTATEPPPPPPAISFYQAVVKEMKTSDDGPDAAHNGIKANSNGKPLLIQGEKAHSPVETTKPESLSSNLSKIRESHLAKRRDHLRPSTMPQLSELSEKENAENNNEEKLLDNLNSNKEDDILPPQANGDVIMPCIPDEFLCKLGLTPEGKSSEELSDQEIESKFTSLSLAFKTDSQTLEKRLEIQERSRDIAEQNVDKELQGLRSGLETLNQICTDPQVREVLTKIQNHIDILEKSTARVSSRAEVFGAIQQEKRMSKAVDIMVHHVENISRVHEREHAELEEARKLLLDSRSLAPSSIDLTGGGELLSRRSASVCQNNMFPVKLAPQGSQSSPLTPTAVKAIKLLKASRRRVSEIALPKVLGGSGAASLHPSASMDSFYTEPRSPRFSLSSPMFRTETSPMFRSETYVDEDEGSNLNTAHLDSLHPNYDPDARSRLQAVIASTAMKSAVANTLRRASLEKQGNVSPSSTPPQVSRDNSSDSSNKQAVEAQDKEKQKNMEEEAFKKGYEQGIRASLGQDLSSLREQQNQINESLGDVMDSIDNQTEEPKSLKEILIERFNENIPKFTISSWRIRMTFGCFFIVMAIISVIMALSPVSMGSAVGLHHYGKPPL